MAYPVADEHNANKYFPPKITPILNPGTTYRMESRMLPVSRMRHYRVTADIRGRRNRA
jgi:hypothetical protein